MEVFPYCVQILSLSELTICGNECINVKCEASASLVQKGAGNTVKFFTCTLLTARK